MNCPESASHVYGVSVFGNTQSPTEQRPAQFTLIDSALSKGLELQRSPTEIPTLNVSMIWKVFFILSLLFLYSFVVFS